MWLKNFNETTWNLLEACKSSETEEITADDFVLVQYSPNTTKVLYIGQVEEKGSYHM